MGGSEVKQTRASTVRRLRRAFAVGMTTTVMTTLVTLLSPSAAQAGTCTAGIFCGSVNNNSRFWMTTTETWNSGPHRCQLWQGNVYNCTQKDLAPLGIRGGRGTGVDVDAFTYNNTDYYWNGYRILKGQWMRIHDTAMYCKADLGDLPRCG